MNQHSSSGKLPKTKRGRQTRESLLQAAEREFGERGFSDASISGITQRAGVALGTFYVYFESKEEVFRGLVSYMGELTRHWVAGRVAQSPDRLSAERQGVEAFIEFVREHRNLYRIVSEAQFVAEDAFREYYSVFADAYREHLERAAEDGEIRDGDCEVWGWALIGMTVFLGMRYSDWDDRRSASDIAAAAADLISQGMARGARD
ncbi:MAG: TetR/AcrR family transcriptional regulator [Gammaproteobacteria bacterium]|nr:TetR/AcrR family transcriptional regulator [Gammaproteobacteria bacterium]